MSRRQVHLGAHFPGVNSTTVWTDPRSRSHVDLSSFEHLARTAEEARLDFFFLAEGLRLREHKGELFDLDVVGRPDTLPVLAALAAVTERLGLVGTITTTFNEPYELARQWATLDLLSRGRAGWNVVTSSDAFHGANFRRGGFLPHAERYTRAAELLDVARQLWDAWDDDAVAAAGAGETFLRPGAVRPVDHRGRQFTVRGEPGTPRGPQGHPVLFQAGDSAEGRDLAAREADVVFTAHSTVEAGQAFYADVKGRLAAHGRTEDDLKVLPAVTVVLGDTEAEARDRARHVREQQVTGPAAIAFLEQLWGRDLTAYDPDGPLPAEDPEPEHVSVTRGRVRHHRDPAALARQWREQAAANRWSIRELVIAVGDRGGLVGTPSSVARQVDEAVQSRACDGYILVPHLTPTGLDDVAARVVPLLQERGVFRADYAGPTLRDHLGLGPARRPTTAPADDRRLVAR